MSESKIIIIQDLLDTRARKERELQFYQEELKKLEEKMRYVQMEIKLTNDIIKMIEQEKVAEIKKTLK